MSAATMWSMPPCTEAWEAVRTRNGWVEIFNPGDEFTQFLENQEQQIGDLMRELGFL